MNALSAQPLPTDDYSQQQQRDVSSQNTPLHGSGDADGKVTMNQPLPNDLQATLGSLSARFTPIVRQTVIPVTPQVAPMTKVNVLLPTDAQNAKPKLAHEKRLKNDPDGQDQLTTLLSQTYASQNTYADKAKMMEYRDQMFQQALAEYPIALIREGFIAHVKRKPAIPTPSDIINIIDPPEPQPDWAAYVGIKNKIKNDIYVTPDQREYLRWCEEQAIIKPKEWSKRIAELETRMASLND